MVKMDSIKSNYYIKKEELRDEAIEYQVEISENNYSLNEIIEIRNYLYDKGKRYGLIKEFKDNGII